MKQSFFEMPDITCIFDLTAFSIMYSVRNYKLCLCRQVIQQVNLVPSILLRESLAGLDLTMHIIFEPFGDQKEVGRSEYIPITYMDLGL